MCGEYREQTEPGYFSLHKLLSQLRCHGVGVKTFEAARLERGPVWLP